MQAANFWETSQENVKVCPSKTCAFNGVENIPQITTERRLGHGEQCPALWCQHTTTMRLQPRCARTVEAPAYSGQQTVRLHVTMPRRSKGNTGLRAQQQERTKSRDSPNHWRSCRAAGVSSSAYSWTNVPTSVTSSASFTFKSCNNAGVCQNLYYKY